MKGSVLSRYLDPEVLRRIARRRFEPGGLVLGSLAGAHASPLHGFAVEFAGHREYVPGDDPRRIDWRVYFAREKVFVKQYSMETNLVCHLILDVSASMRYGDGEEQKLLYGARLAAALAHVIVQQSDKVSLALVDDEVRGVVPATNGSGQIVRMTEQLEGVQPTRPTRLAPCLLELASRMGTREIVLLLSDFLCNPGELEPALGRLRFSKHQVVLFQILHHDELTFELDGRVRFLGLESPEELVASPEEIRASYLAGLEEHQGQLADLARRSGVEHLVVSTRRDLAETLCDYLSAR